MNIDMLQYIGLFKKDTVFPTLQIITN